MKQMKVLLVAMIFGSFVFLYNHQDAEAASVSEAEVLVKEAEGWAGALKWAISVEGDAKVDYPNMDIHNNTGKALDEAQQAVNSLPQSDLKEALQKRINDNVILHFNRSIAFIDAITSGKKIIDRQITLQKYIKSGDIDNTTNAYHKVTEEIRKQAKLLYRVYGKSTRDAMLGQYKEPAEKLVHSVMYEVTVNMELSHLEGKISKGVSHPKLESAITFFNSVSTKSLLYKELNEKLQTAKSTVVMSNTEVKNLLTQKAVDSGIPPEIFKAIAINENRMQQFGESFEPIVTNDGGIGMMQITLKPGEKQYDLEKLKYDTNYNVEIGAKKLLEKWAYSGNRIPVVNDGDKKVLENWYFALMAYNGLSGVNDPTKGNITYQDRVYSEMWNRSFIEDNIPEFIPNNDFVIEDRSNILYFDKKMNYDTTQKTLSTQMYGSGDTVVLKNFVRLRTEPSTISGVVTADLEEGTQVKIQSSFINDNTYSNHYVWYKVSLPSGQTGYVASVSF